MYKTKTFRIFYVLSFYFKTAIVLEFVLYKQQRTVSMWHFMI